MIFFFLRGRYIYKRGRYIEGLTPELSASLAFLQWKSDFCQLV